VEFILGIHIPQYSPFQQSDANLNFTYTMAQAIPKIRNPEVQKVILQATLILSQIAHELGINMITDQKSFVEDGAKREKAGPLITKYLLFLNF
jgi:hypothetical protein